MKAYIEIHHSTSLKLFDCFLLNTVYARYIFINSVIFQKIFQKNGAQLFGRGDNKNEYCLKIDSKLSVLKKSKLKTSSITNLQSRCFLWF